MRRRTRTLAAWLLALTLVCLSGCGAPASAPLPPSGGTEPLAQPLEIYCFAAGAADAFLFTVGDHAALIDCGERALGDTITDYLQEQEIGALDCLILTHFDQDHIGGAADVLKAIPVDRVLQSNCPKDSREYEAYCKALKKRELTAETVREPITFSLGDAVFTVDPPLRDSYANAASNNSSLIVSVQYGAQTLLFPGDAETDRLQEYLNTQPGACSLIKLPHHGRYQPLLSPLLEQLSPVYAVITSSDSEPEDSSVVQMLAAHGTAVFLTRKAAVLISTDGASLTVSYAE